MDVSGVYFRKFLVNTGLQVGYDECFVMTEVNLKVLFTSQQGKILHTREFSCVI
jgi:hypothetical protein